MRQHLIVLICTNALIEADSRKFVKFVSSSGAHSTITADRAGALLGRDFTSQSRSHPGVGAYFFDQQSSATGIGRQRGIHARAGGNQERNDLVVVTGFGWGIDPGVECPP